MLSHDPIYTLYIYIIYISQNYTNIFVIPLNPISHAGIAPQQLPTSPQEDQQPDSQGRGGQGRHVRVAKEMWLRHGEIRAVSGQIEEIQNMVVIS